MTKRTILNHLGIIVRPVTKKDLEGAQSAYQQGARYIVVLPSGVTHYTTSNSLGEILAVIRHDLMCYGDNHC